MEIQWHSPGRENLRLDITVEDQKITEAKMTASGSLAFLRLCQKMKAQLKGPLKDVPLPQGTTPAVLIWREVLQKFQGSWQELVEAEELCHCRKVTTAKVEEAIVYGAHTPEAIRKQTSANTGCGTCLSDIEALIKNRL